MRCYPDTPNEQLKLSAQTLFILIRKKSFRSFKTSAFHLLLLSSITYILDIYSIYLKIAVQREADVINVGEAERKEPRKQLTCWGRADDDEKRKMYKLGHQHNKLVGIRLLLRLGNELRNKINTANGIKEEDYYFFFFYIVHVLRLFSTAKLNRAS